MDLITIIILIVIVVSKFAVKKQGSYRRPNTRPFNDLEKTFKQARTLIDEYIHPSERSHDMKNIQNNRHFQEEPEFESIDSFEGKIRDVDVDTVNNVEVNNESFQYEAVKGKREELNTNKEPEKNIDSEMDYNSYYDLSLTKEDMVKAIIFSEILNKPLCKRDAR